MLKKMIQEIKQVYGITFEQGRNNFKIDEELLANVVTANKEFPDSAKRDLIMRTEFSHRADIRFWGKRAERASP